MRKQDALYDWPILEIARLADSDEADTFASLLDPARLIPFTTITEAMRGLGGEMAVAKANRLHFQKWAELRRSMESFEQQFPEFPNAAFGKFRVLISLADKLAQIAVPIDANDIDEHCFEFTKLPEPLPMSWYCRENSNSLENSVVAFSIDDRVALEREIAGATISPDFIYFILAALRICDLPPAGHFAVSKKSAGPRELESVDAFVRLSILASGGSIHSPRRYQNRPTVLNCDSILPTHKYQQWGDVLGVLSEYNSRDEILLKYLTIYHVIENFMFKFPIVELERQRAGRMFSIRDFRRLYQQVDEAELPSLKRLFTEILKGVAVPAKAPQGQMAATAEILFDAHIVSRWLSLVPTLTLGQVETALGLLGIKKDRRPLRHQEFVVGGECAGIFAQMVYGIRCAIVHNKETEFHLNHESLDFAFVTIIGEFLIPTLEEITFSMISSPNHQVWYSKRELALY